MSSKYKYIPSVALVVGFLISLWYLISNLQPIQPALYAFLVTLVSGLYLVIRIFNNNLLTTAGKYVRGLIRRKHFVLVALSAVLLVGLLARLYFYYRFSYVPISDPMTFYDSAKTLAEGGSLEGNNYVAFQPYLSAYNNLLGVAMRIVPDPWLAAIFLNTLFDILSSFALYILLKKILKPTSQLPVVGFGVWMLNPLSVVFSVISIPVIVVNFFVILTVLITYLLIRQLTKLQTKHTLLLSVALGFTLGFGNSFRPIFIVAIIALTIVCAFIFLTSNRSSKFLMLSLASVVISSIIIAGVQAVNLAFVSNQTGLPAAKSPSGWSMYVGSTWESTGEWRQYHNDQISSICESSFAENDFDKCHHDLQSRAIEHYKEYGVFKSASLFIQKLYNQAGDQNYFYNAEQSMTGYSLSKTQKTINVYMVIFMIVLFFLSAKSLYRLAKNSASNKLAHPILLFMALIMTGWFFSFALVESAPRYSTILYPLFIVFAVLALDKKFLASNSRA